MQTKIKISSIDNGYLVEYEGGKCRGYQVDASNNQIILMLTQVLAAIGEKGYKVVNDHEAAQLHILKRPHDGSAKAESSSL